MVLVLQRRVLVMGPRIILRGAIPFDSNIGGSGHRPCNKAFSLLCIFLLPCVFGSPRCLNSLKSGFYCLLLALLGVFIIIIQCHASILSLLIPSHLLQMYTSLISFCMG